MYVKIIIGKFLKTFFFSNFYTPKKQSVQDIWFLDPHISLSQKIF